ncbi:hypothetical protein ACL9RL_18040 [Plantibacter sp. Mn2098]|uniref:hypothetical protein n=1 Tax=Plantibacter sp. Mn2098 TaxID=3395266 RepID=UPI003BCABFD7
MTTITRKRALIAGAAVLLIAGVSTGGALVTAESTIFGNTFKSQAVTEPPAEITVTGDPMDATFTGSVAGEVESKYFLITNETDATTGKDAKVNIGSLVHADGNKSDLLTNALSTRVNFDGATHGSGKLADMGLAAANQITVPKGQSVQVRVDVFVAQTSDWDPTIGGDATATVDFQFDSIFVPTP